MVPALAALTLLAFGLRLSLMGQSTVGDELYLFELIHGKGLAEVISGVHDTESTPPLHFVMAWASAKVGGDDLLWIRVPSLVLGTAAVPLVYLLGKRTVGRWAALAGAAFFALAPFNVFYASEARAYAAVAFLCAASTLLLLEALRRGGWKWWAGFAVATAAALLTHYTVVFVLAAQLAWALWAHRDQARALLLAYGGAALLFAPWVPSFIVQSRDSAAVRIETLYPLRLGTFLEGMTRVFVGHPSALDRVPGTVGAVPLAVGFALAIGGVIWRFRDRLRPRPEVALLIALVVASPLGTLLFSLGPTSIFLPRNLSASVPAAALVAGLLLTSARREVAIAATALVFAGLAVGDWRTLGSELRRPAYRDIASTLDRAAPRGAPVVEVSIATGPPSRQLGYWFGRPHPYFTTGRPLTEAFRLGRASGRFYVVIPAQGSERFLALLGMPQRGFRLAGKRLYPGAPNLALYTYEPVRT